MLCRLCNLHPVINETQFCKECLKESLDRIGTISLGDGSRLGVSDYAKLGIGDVVEVRSLLSGELRGVRMVEDVSSD